MRGGGATDFGFRSATFVTRAYNRLLRPGLALLSSPEPLLPAPLLLAAKKLQDAINKMWLDAA